VKISLCMITWNEEDLIARALASAEGLADEIILVDTGSRDNTVALAESLGAKIITGADRYHKANARNQAIEASQGDWVVILDADEEIADPVGLRAFLLATDADAVYIRLAFMQGDAPTLTYSQMRIWRRDAFRYKYRAHEVPVPTDGWGKIEHTDFVWEHRPPRERAWKVAYTLARLEIDAWENPGDPRPLYYLGRQYVYAGIFESALDTLAKYIELAPKGRDVANAWQYLGRAHGGLGDEDQQIAALFQACAANPARRDWWGELAAIYHNRGQDDTAVGLLRCALEIEAPEKDYATYYWHGSAIYDLMARCLWKLQRYEEGEEFAEAALELEPDSGRLQTNLLWFQSQLGSMDAFYKLHGPGIHSGCARHEAIAELVEGPRILDVGCGSGDLLMILQDRYCRPRDGFELTGTDISKVALDMARERGFRGKLDLQIPYEAYDTIVMAQVLEHIPNDRDFVSALLSRLVPNGKLIVSVPNNGRIPAADHKRDYTVQSLRDVLSIVGTPELHSWSGEENRILMSVRKHATPQG